MDGAGILVLVVFLIGFIVFLISALKISSWCSRQEEYRLAKKYVDKQNRHKEYMRKWRENNREKYNEYHRNYQKEKRNQKNIDGGAVDS